jgi:hypothetical protein
VWLDESGERQEIAAGIAAWMVSEAEEVSAGFETVTISWLDGGDAEQDHLRELLERGVRLGQAFITFVNCPALLGVLQVGGHPPRRVGDRDHSPGCPPGESGLPDGGSRAS